MPYRRRPALSRNFGQSRRRVDSSHRRLLQDPSTTQVYDRPSHPRRVEAVRAIAATYQFDLTGGRLRARNYADDLADRIRAGVGSVPFPAGRCHEMNNVRADGHRCPVYNRCFSCAFCTTDFTHLPELRQLRRGSGSGRALDAAAAVISTSHRRRVGVRSCTPLRTTPNTNACARVERTFACSVTSLQALMG